MDGFSWALGLGSEVQVNDWMSFQLGVSIGSLFDSGLEDVDPGFFLSSTVWTDDNLFIKLDSYFEEDVHFGGGIGFTF
jgi:hypothetical protein